jgi:uncharacterized spore protein YtfJ
LKKITVGLFVAGVLFLSLAGPPSAAQEKTQPQVKPPNPVVAMTEAMVSRLNDNLQVKNVIGKPMKIGRVTIIPILLVDFGFGGGGGGPAQQSQMGGRGFYMSGEARPLGFVVISKTGTQFISAGKVPRK